MNSEPETVNLDNYSNCEPVILFSVHWKYDRRDDYRNVLSDWIEDKFKGSKCVDSSGTCAVIEPGPHDPNVMIERIKKHAGRKLRHIRMDRDPGLGIMNLNCGDAEWRAGVARRFDPNVSSETLNKVELLLSQNKIYFFGDLVDILNEARKDGEKKEGESK